MRNFKANRLCHLFKHDVIDVAALQEVCVNWSVLLCSHRRYQYFLGWGIPDTYGGFAQCPRDQKMLLENKEAAQAR